MVTRVGLWWVRTRIRCLNGLRSWLFAATHRDRFNYYSYLGTDELRRTKSSDTLFIFGSGSSINDLTSDEWRQCEACNTLAFNQFIRQEFVELDYYLVREIGGIDHRNTTASNRVYDRFREAVRRPWMAETVYLLQKDLLADVSIEVEHRFLLPERSRIWFYRTLSRESGAVLSDDLDAGLIHAGGTLTDAVSFGYAMAYTSIVLVGVDLYDRRYFWLKDDQTRAEDAQRGASHRDAHNTAQPIIDIMRRWTLFLSERGVSLTVYNPRSLLAEVMPVYRVQRKHAGGPETATHQTGPA